MYANQPGLSTPWSLTAPGPPRYSASSAPIIAREVTPNKKLLEPFRHSNRFSKWSFILWLRTQFQSNTGESKNICNVFLCWVVAWFRGISFWNLIVLRLSLSFLPPLFSNPFPVSFCQSICFIFSPHFSSSPSSGLLFFYCWYSTSHFLSPSLSLPSSNSLHYSLSPLLCNSPFNSPFIFSPLSLPYLPFSFLSPSFLFILCLVWLILSESTPPPYSSTFFSLSITRIIRGI